MSSQHCFTDAKIGIAADIDLVNLKSGAVTISGTLMQWHFPATANKFSVTLV